MADAFARNQVPSLAEDALLRLSEHESEGGGAGVAAEGAGAVAAGRELFVEGVERVGYKMVPSSLLLLTMVTQYMQCVSSLQTVGPQVAHLLPSLLKLYNMLANKQVLKGGALRPESAGLKSITFKHLALASQSLSLVLALIPHLKAILTAYVPESQRGLLADMDAALADYEKHGQELLAKFVSILEERRRQHVNGGSGDAPSLAQALAPSEEKRRPEETACIKMVTKDLTTMHKQLQPLLSRTHLHTVFVQVLEAFDDGLLAAYQAVDTSPLITRQCIVADVLYLRQNVGKLHLALPQGCCPQLTNWATKTLSVT